MKKKEHNEESISQDFALEEYSWYGESLGWHAVYDSGSINLRREEVNLKEDEERLKKKIDQDKWKKKKKMWKAIWEKKKKN